MKSKNWEPIIASAPKGPTFYSQMRSLFIFWWFKTLNLWAINCFSKFIQYLSIRIFSPKVDSLQLPAGNSISL